MVQLAMDASSDITTVERALITERTALGLESVSRSVLVPMSTKATLRLATAAMARRVFRMMLRSPRWIMVSTGPLRANSFFGADFCFTPSRDMVNMYKLSESSTLERPYSSGDGPPSTTVTESFFR